MEWIWEDTRYSPVYTYSDDDPRDYDPEANGHASGGASQSRPRICTIEKYDFAVVCKLRFFKRLSHYHRALHKSRLMRSL